jgi:hypothetical protein
MTKKEKCPHTVNVCHDTSSASRCVLDFFSGPFGIFIVGRLLFLLLFLYVVLSSQECNGKSSYLYDEVDNLDMLA